ncbi:MAG: succinate dehydrogenase cytochrome b subunit [Fuerstiella sp.]|nr:succinate dehydrogenase cytochrome b subunit [Fuerstiella sp.]MCP4858553.1 succinate dehydrogenase cytochrome b subunit [Fuerstiella sp.]
MALTGLALCGFLVAHLSGNLLLFAGEEQFNAYAERLHSMGLLLKMAEVGLLVTFLAHLGLAVSTTAMSRRARSKQYAEKESKQGAFAIPNGGASNWMLLTGLGIGAFLVLHLVDLKFKERTDLDYGTQDGAYATVHMVLSSPISFVAYGVALILLGIHLSHGIRSALQSLGVSHPKWNKLIEFGSMFIAWAIALGFICVLGWVILNS